MSNLTHLFTRRRTLEAVPDPRPSESFARAREAAEWLRVGEWDRGQRALAEAWWLAVTHGEQVPEPVAASVMRELVSVGWTPGDAA